MDKNQLRISYNDSMGVNDSYHTAHFNTLLGYWICMMVKKLHEVFFQVETNDVT